ncbi:SNF2 family N-terminal domain-containing protein [Hygrophoropsis aurantiaca]|uniref:SNF2 family N-terminal domain-containing protein n=1 Tax=Hygrophoropsis aurantiaca TaxID=72124 RepID=A0ACB8AH45_9AGAM|nr:SNF2 family N-terminal domain-containing protein [Hygrophoropsis aurantiaca]
MQQVRTLTENYVESARHREAFYWSSRNPSFPCDFRPAINLSSLINSLKPPEDENEEEENDENDEENSVCGGKRQRSSSPDASGRNKRRKVDTEGSDNPNEDSDSESVSSAISNPYDEDYVEPQYRLVYPPIWETRSKLDGYAPSFDTESTFLPVFRHTFEIRYTKALEPEESNENFVDDHAAKKLGWLKEETELAALFNGLRDEVSGQYTHDLGKFWITEYRGRLLALSGEPGGPINEQYPEERKEASEMWLFLLPQVPWSDGLTEQELVQYEIHPGPAHEGIIAACITLQSLGIVKVDTNLRLVSHKEGEYDSNRELPFHLQVDITASFVLPEIYNPFSAQQYSQRKMAEIEGLLGRFMAFVSFAPLNASLSENEGFDGDATIPFFYSILRPASAITSKTIQSLQPDGLVPTLLPFQSRTVAWMLSREGKELASDGNIIPHSGHANGSNDASQEDTSDSSLPLFWKKVAISGNIFYVNRLTHSIRSDPPEVQGVAFGGILAEEPGLGKTMECISLMLLNPAPDRNPTNKRWDAATQIEVKEIKTTLIVTPPALAPQWADELAAHAPGLKVLIYDGWSKVTVPITQADVEAERQRRLGPKAKSSSKAQSSPRKNGKGKAKAESPESMDIDESPLGSTMGDSSSNDEILDWCSYINTFDVCITTYNVLRQDLTVARAPPKRPRREDIGYSNLERPRSPLVICEWYRVIMDEVQMMGTGKSEEMVSLIPRFSSFAVSGTPARNQVADLIRILRFLRVDDLVGSKRMWNRLLKHGYKELFAALFQQFAVRTLKSSVKDELTIPQQTRFLVSIELGRIERHVYDQNLESALVELGLDARGVAASEGWQIDGALLRSLIRNLRGICTHPQVGQLQRPGDKLFKAGALKSIGEVLEAMRDQNWRNLMDDRKAKIQSLVRYAQLHQHNQNNIDRYQRALETLLGADNDMDRIIDEIRVAIAEHNAKGEVLKKEALALKESRKQLTNGHSTKVKGKGKEKERDGSPVSDDDPTNDDLDLEDSDLPKTPAGEEHSIKKRALQQRLRECLLVLHRVKFLLGDIYHVLGPSQSEKEDASYAAAEVVRKDLLRFTEETAAKAMSRLRIDVTHGGVSEQALLIKSPYLDDGALTSSDLVDEANEIIDETLNEQSQLLWQWRTRIYELLTQKLAASGDQADGEEYSRTLDIQGEAETLLQAYAAILADRREAIIAERTLLAAHDARERKMRRTKAALAAAQVMPDLQIPDDVDVQPQHEVLHKDLAEQRKALRDQFAGRALKSIMVDLMAVTGSRIKNPKTREMEKTIAKNAATKLRSLIAHHVSLQDQLDTDLSQLRKIFNVRILYFRQLQEISDSVSEVIWEGGVVAAIEASEAEQIELEGKINTGRARQRYLDHLAKNKEDGIMDEDDETCILCRCDFKRGFVTQCAHIFCEGCMKAWLARREGRACPVCRVVINVDQLQRFTVEADKPAPPKPVLANDEPAPTSRREIHYNRIDPNIFTEIEAIESNGSYGSKIQTLVRHLLYLQTSDPGSKSIVFSAWADSLHIIEHALNYNGIPCLRIDQAKGKRKDSATKKFRTDPRLLVLLLHGERDNAGLNVTCASRVFLVESVVNHGFEVQAIARIDRMGQTLPTEVFCYYAEDTVERNILDLAARQGLSLYTKDNSAGSLNVTPFAMDSQKVVDSVGKQKSKQKSVQKGDFIFKIDDMLAILFPHMFEELEYLLPSAESLDNPDAMQVDAPNAPVQHVNAVAGPSRLQ